MLAVLYLCAAASLYAQTTGGLRGQVLDPSGAAIPNAAVTVTGPNRAAKTVATDEAGSFTLAGLAPGEYTVRATAAGFAPFESRVSVADGRVTALDIGMTVTLERQEVTVSETQTSQVRVDPSQNAAQIVVQGKDLDSLSDNAEDLEADLLALAGPSVGPSGGQIFLDGFSSGDLTGKEQIREVRVNSNPFSAEFDKPGFGRIEVVTRSGTDRLRGSADFNIADSALNARNPYSLTKPPTQMRLFDVNLTGPLSKTLSFTVDAVHQTQDSTALINAVDPFSPLQQQRINQLVQAPFVRRNIAPRLDYTIRPNITFTARYSWFHPTIDNNGVGGFTLLSRATSSVQTHQSGTFTLSVLEGSHYVNETRFQYHHLSNDQRGDSGSPAIVVQGAFSFGGAPFANNWTREGSYEFHNLSSYTRGAHFFKFGVRVRAWTVSDYSTTNFNGTYTFTSLDQYRLTLQGLAAPFQYSLTTGTPLSRLSQADAEPYLQDDWKVRPNVTLSLGMRYEAQTNAGGYRDWAPRAALAWGLGGGGTRAPKTVLRLGYGIFYDRIDYSLILQALRQNGVTQHFFVVQPSPFFPVAQPPGPLWTEAIQRLSNTFEAPRNMQSAVTLERQLPKNISVSISYINTRGVHQLREHDINAPLPGAPLPGAPLPGAPLAGSGVFPYGNADPIYLYESSALYKQSQLTVNVNARVNSRFSLFGYYSYGRASSDSDGSGTFPADNYNLAAEWGRAGFDIRHRAQISGSMTLPWGVQFAPNISMSSAPPINITTGPDLNGDTLLTDRPAFATVPADPAHGVLATRWGVFNLDPLHNPGLGSVVIPRNFGTAYGRWDISGRVSRTWGFGERPATGGGRGAKRYALTAGLQGRNWFNHVNPGSPVAVLSSPFFGQALNLQSGQGSTANRRLEASLRFGF